VPGGSVQTRRCVSDRGYGPPWSKPLAGSSNPQRLASCSESEVVVAPVPQLPHLKATSSLGGLVMAHSFSGDVRACRLLVLLLRGRLTAGTEIQRSRPLAAGAGGTFRCR
jgi:hypothetical protein